MSCTRALSNGAPRLRSVAGAMVIESKRTRSTSLRAGIPVPPTGP